MSLKKFTEYTTESESHPHRQNLQDDMVDQEIEQLQEEPNNNVNNDSTKGSDASDINIEELDKLDQVNDINEGKVKDMLFQIEEIITELVTNSGGDLMQNEISSYAEKILSLFSRSESQNSDDIIDSEALEIEKQLREQEREDQLSQEYQQTINSTSEVEEELEDNNDVNNDKENMGGYVNTQGYKDMRKRLYGDEETLKEDKITDNNGDNNGDNDEVTEIRISKFKPTDGEDYGTITVSTTGTFGFEKDLLLELEKRLATLTDSDHFISVTYGGKMGNDKDFNILYLPADKEEEGKKIIKSVLMSHYQENDTNTDTADNDTVDNNIEESTDFVVNPQDPEFKLMKQELGSDVNYQQLKNYLVEKFPGWEQNTSSILEVWSLI